MAGNKVNEQDRTVALSTESFGEGLRDDLIGDAAGKADQADHSPSRRSQDSSPVRINEGQPPAIPSRGRDVSQRIHFPSSGFDGELPGDAPEVSAYR